MNNSAVTAPFVLDSVAGTTTVYFPAADGDAHKVYAGSRGCSVRMTSAEWKELAKSILTGNAAGAIVPQPSMN